jgi:hypothetical protein
VWTPLPHHDRRRRRGHWRQHAHLQHDGALRLRQSYRFSRAHADSCARIYRGATRTLMMPPPTPKRPATRPAPTHRAGKRMVERGVQWMSPSQKGKKHDACVDGQWAGPVNTCTRGAGVCVMQCQLSYPRSQHITHVFIHDQGRTHTNTPCWCTRAAQLCGSAA